MTIKFNVGENEKHEVEFHFNKFWGNIHFKVDSKKVLSDFIMFSTSTSKNFKIVVGEMEKHTVEVVWERPRWFAGFRGGWKYDVLVDGKVIRSETD